MFASLACVLLLTLAICYAGHIQVINGWRLPVLNTLAMDCLGVCVDACVLSVLLLFISFIYLFLESGMVTFC